VAGKWTSIHPCCAASLTCCRLISCQTQTDAYHQSLGMVGYRQLPRHGVGRRKTKKTGPFFTIAKRRWHALPWPMRAPRQQLLAPGMRIAGSTSQSETRTVYLHKSIWLFSGAARCEPKLNGRWWRPVMEGARTGLVHVYTVDVTSHHSLEGFGFI
jgi:hypothetical protein